VGKREAGVMISSPWTLPYVFVPDALDDIVFSTIVTAIVYWPQM
jgi:hypothetical protein